MPPSPLGMILCQNLKLGVCKLVCSCTCVLLFTKSLFFFNRFWHGLTCLHKLCLRMDNSIDAVLLALELGADLEARNNFEETSLMFAAKRGSASLCSLLINRGGIVTT